MMSAALAFATALAVSGPAPAVSGPDVAQLVRDACVSTGMRRDAFERLARERGWRRARTTLESGPPGGWNVLVNGNGATFILTHVPDFSPDASLGSLCSVSVERADPALEGDVGALAAGLGLTEETVTGLPPGGVPMRTWSRFGEWTLTYAAAPDGRAVVSLSRQIVTEGPSPAPSSGVR